MTVLRKIAKVIAACAALVAIISLVVLGLARFTSDHRYCGTEVRVNLGDGSVQAFFYILRMPIWRTSIVRPILSAAEDVGSWEVVESRNFALDSHVSYNRHAAAFAIAQIDSILRVEGLRNWPEVRRRISRQAILLLNKPHDDMLREFASRLRSRANKRHSLSQQEIEELIRDLDLDE